MVCMMSWQWGQLYVMVALEAASQVSVHSWYWQRLGRRDGHHQHQTISLDLSCCGCKHLGSGAEQLCGACVSVNPASLPVSAHVMLSLFSVCSGPRVHCQCWEALLADRCSPRLWGEVWSPAGPG